MKPSFVLQSSEEFLFYLLQQVEANKNIVLVLEIDVLLLNHLAVEHTFVGQPFGLQRLSIACVDGCQVLPDGIEILLEWRIVDHLVEKLLQALLLFLAQKASIFHALPCL
jgi:hypothetical protein